MSIAARLAALERALTARACPRCSRGDGSGGNVRFTVCTEPNPEPPVPCPECGRAPIRFTFNIGTAGMAEDAR